MKSPKLAKIEPIREYWENGKLKSEKYLIHMSYIVYRYDKKGNNIGLSVNGIEYPVDSELIFSGTTLKVQTK